MSAAVIARNRAHQPVGTLAAKSPRVHPFYRLRARGFAVRSASRAKGVAGPVAGSSHGCPHGAYAGRSRDGIKDPSICKSLQAWVGPRTKTFLDVPTISATDVATLIIKILRVNEKMTGGLGLADRLLDLSAYGYGHYSNGCLQFGGASGLSPKPKRRQAPRDRGCPPPLRVEKAGVRSGVAFPRLRCWRYATWTGTAGVKVASTWSLENCVGGSSRKTC
jgi:hypothetical protein